MSGTNLLTYQYLNLHKLKILDDYIINIIKLKNLWMKEETRHVTIFFYMIEQENEVLFTYLCFYKHAKLYINI